MNKAIDNLQKVRFSSGPGASWAGPAHGSLASGSRREVEPSKAIDICGKIVELGELKSRKRKSDGADLKVADLTLADDSGVNFDVTVWQEETYNKLKDIPRGHGISILRCTATKDVQANAFKVSLWPKIIVIEGGTRAEQLTSLSIEQVSANRKATAQFVGTAMDMDVTGKEAVPITTTALNSIPEDATDFPAEIVWQINRATITAPVLEQDITSRNGDKLWIRAEVHDWTGSATVYITDKAAPTLHGCESTEEVLQKAKKKLCRSKW